MTKPLVLFGCVKLLKVFNETPKTRQIVEELFRNIIITNIKTLEIDHLFNEEYRCCLDEGITSSTRKAGYDRGMSVLTTKLVNMIKGHKTNRLFSPEPEFQRIKSLGLVEYLVQFFAYQMRDNSMRLALQLDFRTHMYSNNLTLFKTTNVKFSKKVENLTDALRIDKKLFKLPSKKDIFVKPEAVDLSPTELNLFYEHLFSGAFVEAKRLYDEVFIVEGKNIGIPLELEYTYVYLLIKSKFIALLFDNTENRILQVTDFSLGERQIEEFFKEVKTFEQLVLYKSASPNPTIIPSLLKDKITKPVLKVL